MSIPINGFQQRNVTEFSKYRKYIFKLGLYSTYYLKTPSQGVKGQCKKYLHTAVPNFLRKT